MNVSGNVSSCRVNLISHSIIKLTKIPQRCQQLGYQKIQKLHAIMLFLTIQYRLHASLIRKKGRVKLKGRKMFRIRMCYTCSFNVVGSDSVTIRNSLPRLLKKGTLCFKGITNEFFVVNIN